MTDRTPWVQGHTLLARISGADAPALTDAVATHTRPKPSIKPLAQTDATPAAPEKEESQEELHERLRGLMNKDKVVLFLTDVFGLELINNRVRPAPSCSRPLPLPLTLPPPHRTATTSCSPTALRTMASSASCPTSSPATRARTRA